jgi:hypothetical protein
VGSAGSFASPAQLAVPGLVPASPPELPPEAPSFVVPPLLASDGVLVPLSWAPLLAPPPFDPPLELAPELAPELLPPVDAPPEECPPPVIDASLVPPQAPSAIAQGMTLTQPPIRLLGRIFSSSDPQAGSLLLQPSPMRRCRSRPKSTRNSSRATFRCATSASLRPERSALTFFVPVGWSGH